MAIPNLAPGYLNQVKAAQDRAELERERMRFEDEQRRKALQERVGMEFLGTALGIGGKAAIDAATEAIRKPRVEAERELKEYQTSAPLALESGAYLGGDYGTDPDEAAKILARERRGTASPMVRAEASEGRAVARPMVKKPGVYPGAGVGGRTAAAETPADSDSAIRRLALVTEAKAPPAGEVLKAPLARRGAAAPARRPDANAVISKAKAPPAPIETRGPRRPGPTPQRLETATEDPRFAIEEKMRPALRFKGKYDKQLYELAQAGRRRRAAGAAETARKAQLELRKQRQAEYKDRLARTDKFREWAATRNDATYNNQNVLDAFQDASNRLRQGQFERGTIVVSMREWVRSQPTPELQKKAYEALPPAMQAQYDLGYTEMLERAVTKDEAKRYVDLFNQARADKGKKGRTTGSTGPRFSLIPGGPEVPLIDIPRGKGGSSERINLLDQKTLGFLYEDAPKFIQSGGQQDFRKGIGSMRRVLREVKRAKKWTPELVGEYEKLASNAAKALNANKSSVAAFIEQFGALKKAGATAEKAEKEAKKAAKAEGKEGRKVLADLRSAWRRKEKSLQSALESSSGLPSGSLGLRKSQVISAGVTRINSGPGNQREKKAAVKAFSSKVNKAFRTWGATKRKERSEFAKSWAYDNRERIQAEYPAGGPALLRRFSGGSDGSEPAGQSQFMGQPPGPAAAQPPGRRQPSVGDDDQAAVDLELKMDRAFREINARNLPASVKRRMFDAYTRQLGVA